MTWSEVQPPAGLRLEQLTAAQARQFATAVRDECQGQVRAGSMTEQQARFEAGYLRQLSLYEFYRAEFWLVCTAAGEPRTLHVAAFGTSPRKNAWGRYVNHYLAFTRPGYRGQGWGSGGELALQEMAAGRGYDRLKTLCQSWLGVLYHERLRDLTWGVNEKGELVIDSPLHDGPWPEGVPIKARKYSTGELDGEELYRVLTDPAGCFRAAPRAAADVLVKRLWRRGQDSNLGGDHAPTPETGMPSAAQPPPQPAAG